MTHDKCAIFFFAAFVVLVRTQDAASTGAEYQLTCTVTVNGGSVPTITWISSDVEITSNSSGMYVGSQMTSNEITSTSQLLFSPLSSEHQGNYTCQASLGEVSYSYTYLVIVIASE